MVELPPLITAVIPEARSNMRVVAAASAADNDAGVLGKTAPLEPLHGKCSAKTLGTETVPVRKNSRVGNQKRSANALQVRSRVSSAEAKSLCKCGRSRPRCLAVS